LETIIVIRIKKLASLGSATFHFNLSLSSRSEAQQNEAFESLIDRREKQEWLKTIFEHGLDGSNGFSRKAAFEDTKSKTK
jgi:hypothetical protein